MKKSSVRLFFMLFLMASTLSVMMSSCKHEIPIPVLVDGGNNGGGGNGGNSDIPCDPDTVYFFRDIQPIFNSNCIMCHNENYNFKGVILTSYSNVMSTADIEPFQLNAGDLYELITEMNPNDSDDVMPPGSRPPFNSRNPLSASDINTIRTWILQGAQNLFCDACDTSQIPTWSATVKPIVDQNCVNCHNSSSQGGGYNFSSHSGVAIAITMNNEFLRAIRHDPNVSPMPKFAPKLRDCDITNIQKWIDAGYLNN